jgi:hypothetical protein
MICVSDLVRCLDGRPAGVVDVAIHSTMRLGRRSAEVPEVLGLKRVFAPSSRIRVHNFHITNSWKPSHMPRQECHESRWNNAQIEATLTGPAANPQNSLSPIDMLITKY